MYSEGQKSKVCNKLIFSGEELSDFCNKSGRDSLDFNNKIFEEQKLEIFVTIIFLRDRVRVAEICLKFVTNNSGW